MRVPPRAAPPALACLKTLLALLTFFALLTIPSSAGALSVQCQDDGIACVAGTGYQGQPFWGYGVDSAGNNCTTYVAFRLAQNGMPNPGPFGDAGDWADRATDLGFRVDDSPEVGSIAHWPKGRFAPEYGHIAYVEQVLPGAVVLSESNYRGGSRRWTVRRSDWEWPADFIHLRDLSSGSISTGPEPARSRLLSGFSNRFADPMLRIECPVYGTGCVASVTGWATVRRRNGKTRRFDLGVRIFELEPGAAAERSLSLPRGLKRERRTARSVVLTLRTDTLEVRRPTFVRLRLE